MSSTNDPIAQTFRDEVASYLAISGMSKSAFGKAALNDPAFIDGLNDGRDLRLSTMRRVRDWMASHPLSAKKTPPTRREPPVKDVAAE